jgi:hypothetical protein
MHVPYDFCPLDDNHPFYPKIKNHGLEVDPDRLEAAIDSIHGVVICGLKIIVVDSPAEKRRALQMFSGKRLLARIREQGLEGELEPLLWEEMCSEGLVLYRERDKSFWLWYHVGSWQLEFLGYYWTDIFEPELVI